MAELDLEYIKKVMENDNFEMRSKMRKVINSDIFRPRYNISVDEERELAYQRLKIITKAKLFSVRDLIRNPLKIFAAHEVAGVVDGSMATKMTVQFNLFGGTVLKLGTEKHKSLIDSIDVFEDVGCFALTELGYGNNAVEMETTADYDAEKKEFVIHSPTVLSQKYWITNSVCHANWCVVFAQLKVNGKNEGIHGFLVKIRDEKKNIVKGVRIEDMGVKFGCNGVDNGKLFFNKVRVPKWALLNAISDIDENGVFHSKIKKLRNRFLKVADQLLSGRICISGMCLTSSKVSLQVAVRYSQTRLAVGKTGKSDAPIFSYQLQQNTLIPLIADVYAMSVALNYVKNKFAKELKESFEGEVLILCCIIKPFITWSGLNVSNTCRERCGGQGYLSCNKIGQAIEFAHAGITAEGDNKVLMQKVVKELLVVLKKGGITLFNMSKRLQFDKKDENYFVSLFQKRFENLIFRLANRIKNKVEEKKMDLFDVWMHQESDLIQSVAVAFGEVTIAKQFCTLINQKTANSATNNVLNKLYLLYVYKCVERGSLFFLAEKMIKGEEILKIQEEVQILCKDLSQNASQLVDCFSIDKSAIAAPIASDWAEYNVGDNKGEISKDFLKSFL